MTRIGNLEDLQSIERVETEFQDLERLSFLAWLELLQAAGLGISAYQNSAWNSV